jgi:hypothetical protein
MTSAAQRAGAREAYVLGRGVVRNHDEQIIVAVRSLLAAGTAAEQVDRFGRQRWHDPLEKHDNITVDHGRFHRFLDRSMSSTSMVSPW